ASSPDPFVSRRSGLRAAGSDGVFTRNDLSRRLTRLGMRQPRERYLLQPDLAGLALRVVVRVHTEHDLHGTVAVSLDRKVHRVGEVHLPGFIEIDVARRCVPSENLERAAP